MPQVENSTPWKVSYAIIKYIIPFTSVYKVYTYVYKVYEWNISEFCV